MANAVELADTIPPVPTETARIFDFAAWQALHPNEPLPGSQVNNEFDRTDDAINLVADRLALIQRDDGGLMNESVRLETLDPEVLAQLGESEDAAAASAAAAAASAASAAASEAAAEVAATDAEASQASAAASELNAASSAAAAAASEAAAEAAAAVMPPLPSPADADKALVLDPAGTAYTFATVIRKAVDGIYDTLGIRLRGVDAVAGTELTTLQQVTALITSGGSLPAPLPGDVGKVLTATGPAAFNWLAFVAAQISDATAYMRGLLTTVNDAAGLLAAAGAAPAGQGVPVPANPGDDGKTLKAQGGAFSWQTRTQLVPMPANPADDGKALLAAAGAYGWTVIRQVPNPIAGDVGKFLSATGAGAYAWTAVPASAVQATELVAGIAQVATQVETDAGAIDTDFVTPLKLVVHIATKLLAAARAVTGLWTFTDSAIVTQALAVVTGAVAWNTALGHQGRLALSANATMSAPTGDVEGGYYHLEIVSAGAFTLAFNAYYHFADGAAPTITPSGRDEFVFHKRGAAFYEVGRNQNVI